MPAKRKRASAAGDASPSRESSRSASAGSDELEEEQIKVPSGESPFQVEYRMVGSKLAARVNKAHKAKRARTLGPPKAVKADGPPPPQDIDREPPKDEEPSVYIVKPKKDWDALKKYRNFVVGTENFAIGDYIFVNHNTSPITTGDKAVADDRQFWVARVLEIRAKNEAHVYLRIYWMYWPEELPNGREYYHGMRELVASNHMEVIDAMTVSGRANVAIWHELDEEEDLSEYFWRQKFDIPSRTLLHVREHCRCRRYYNPDEILYGCDGCKTWLHDYCIIDDIKTKLLSGELKPPAKPDDTKAPTVPAPEPAVATAPVKKPTVGGRKTLFQSAIEAHDAAAAASAAAAAPAPVPVTPSSSKSNGAPTTTAAKGTGRRGRPRKTPKKEKVDDKDLIEVKIDVSGSGSTTKAIITDRRTKDADGDENMDGETAGERTWSVEIPCFVCGRLLT